MNLFQRYLAEEFAEDYQEGRITRREALRLIASVTGSVVVASSILAACAPAGNETPTGAVIPTTGGPAVADPTATGAATAASTATEAPTAAATEAAATTAATEEVATPAGGLTPEAVGTVSADDPAVEAREVTFAGEDGQEVMAYLATPAGDNQRPVVLVCHENRGLTTHIQDVTRRLAKAGYVALAVDLLSRNGGTAALGSDAIPGALGNTNPDQFVADFRAGWNYLKTEGIGVTDRVGMVGFCFGGGVTWRVATRMPELKAAVPFYGPPPPVEDVPNIQAAVLAIYGGLDDRINQTIPAIEEAMKANNKVYEKMIYDGADHAFHNDTSTRYNAEAARDAWTRALAWFEQYL